MRQLLLCLGKNDPEAERRQRAPGQPGPASGPETGRDELAAGCERAATELDSNHSALQEFERPALPSQAPPGIDADQRTNEGVQPDLCGCGHRGAGYPPSHPWHYLPQGDNASPIPFERISPSEESGRWLHQELPKNVRRRLAALREMLKREEQQLLADRQRYEEIVARGADALSRYDREIAYGGNDGLARAATLALKFNHIRLGKGRVDWLTQEVHRLDAAELLFRPGTPAALKPTED